jgi:hypothetical protein
MPIINVEMLDKQLRVTNDSVLGLPSVLVFVSIDGIEVIQRLCTGRYRLRLHGH